MRTDMLPKISESHQGIVKSKQRARSILFWPGMNADVENVVSSCVTCQQFRKNQASEPLISHDIPDRSWAKLAVDMFSIKGTNYLILVDYYFKLPEIAVLPSLCSSAVTDALENIFSRLGIPEELISDNGSNLVSDEFNRFCMEWDFDQSTSSPGFARSNGQAKRGVQTVKNLL